MTPEQANQIITKLTAIHYLLSFLTGLLFCLLPVIAARLK